MTVAAAPSKVGFLFHYWLAIGDISSGALYPGDEFPCTESMTITAQWTADTTDTDGDGVLDFEEETGCENTVDCDNDGLTDNVDADDLNADQDDDGVLDGAEESGCITSSDCDADGLGDADDSNDLDADQDDDGVNDGSEQDPTCITDPDCDDDGSGISRITTT